jgi:cell pole-organizing protein PopZ
MGAWNILAGTRREDETEGEPVNTVRRDVFASVVREEKGESEAHAANNAESTGTAEQEPSMEDMLTSVQRNISADHPDETGTETATGHEAADLGASPRPDEPVAADNGDARAGVQARPQADSDKLARMLDGLGVGEGFDPRVVEGIATDLLRPWVRQWVSQSLPNVIESLVRDEIEHVASQIKR